MTFREELRLRDRWLQGRSLMLRKQGLDYLSALAQAVLDWQEQERLAAQHEQDRRANGD